MKRLFPFALCALLFNSVSLKAQTNLFVAADGSAQFKTVQEAIMAVPSGSRENPVVIHIAPGIYKELIYIQREKRFFKLVGENATNTVLTYNLNANMKGADDKPIGTFKTPSTTIDADDFTGENLTFENSAGNVGQALAIRVDGDRATFRNCRFLGWQDTILLNRGRQYFENCYIDGAVDFIFGAATAWFEKCQINCLGGGCLTAASTPVDQPFGFVFSNCKITGEPGAKTFLGRPWRIYASTIYLNCEMSDVVRPEGWNDWKKPEAHTAARYAEFGSYGAGGSPTNRPDWTKQLTKADAEKITVEKVLGGMDGWRPNFNPAFSANRLNIQYGKAGGEKLLLDAHVPAGDGKFPVVIIVHGGGWSSGDKETDIVPVFAPFATNFTWFTINYRLAPTNRWPACYDDVQTAICWVKKHAVEFKGDPNRIALLGYSAGGHLVTLAGTRADADTRVQAVAAFAPPTDLVADNERRGGLSLSMRNLFNCDSTNLTENVRAVLKENSPLTYVQPGLPPFLIIQGGVDKTVPAGQSLAFQEKLRVAGDSCDLIMIPGGQHRIADWTKFDPSWQGKLIAWLSEKLAEFSSLAQSPVGVTLEPARAGEEIAPDYLGLSFEMQSVLAGTNGNHFFSASNRRLIATFKMLGIKNLRVGGNTADRPTLPVPNQTDVDNLFAFAKAAGVKVIYTLRLNHGDPGDDAKMADYISRHYKNQLDCFAIGNEPNVFSTNYEAYIVEWKRYAAQITAPTNLPDAKFSGPGVSPGHETWSARFADDPAAAGKIKFISQHDYPGGDARKAADAAAARDKILSPAMDEHYAKFANNFVPTVISNGLAFRFEEANSFYDGGAPDVSDTFASALWALDYQWWWAAHGMSGINFHTGDKVAARDENKPCRYATFWTSTNGYNVHPIGYAEKMFSLGSRGKMIPVKILAAQNDLNFAAYAVLGGDKIIYVTLINKSHDADATNLSVQISAQQINNFTKCEIIRLTAPDGDVSRKTGVTLGGAEITDDAKWNGKWGKIPSPHGNSQSPILIELPAASAALIKLTP